MQSSSQPSPSTSVNPIRRTAKAFSGKPRGRPPNINKAVTGAKAMKGKDQSFLSTSNPYSWLYTQAMSGSVEANAAINMMMSKYKQELLRQYAVGTTNPALTNPFTQKSTSAKIDEARDSTKPTQSTSEKREPVDKLRYSKESNKSYFTESQKEISGNLNIFKDRPGISITPIQHTSTSVTSSSPAITPAHISSVPVLKSSETSPGKTLQQKLADRQKLNPSTQQKSNVNKSLKNTDNQQGIISQLQSLAQKHIPFGKPSTSSPAHSLNTNLENLQKTIPSSLTITKTQPHNLIPSLHTNTAERGISISHVSTASNYKPDGSSTMNFRKPHVPKTKTIARKIGSEITLTPNFPKTSVEQPKPDFTPNIPTFSVSKTDSNTKKDDVEIITIE